MLKSIFEGIAFLFEEVLFLPFNFFRDLELESWFGANILNWDSCLLQWQLLHIG